MQRKTAVYSLAVSLILVLGVPVAHNVAAHTRLAHAARPADRVTACGVERWRVKVAKRCGRHHYRSVERAASSGHPAPLEACGEHDQIAMSPPASSGVRARIVPPQRCGGKRGYGS
jgi:hypothetical protein